MATNTDLYRSARDQLVALIGDYDKAVDDVRVAAAHRLLQLGDRLVRRRSPASRRPRTAPRCGSSRRTAPSRRSRFAEMADRSDQVATWLARLGVGKGDRVILMLGNQVELWETMLAVAKLGASSCRPPARSGPPTSRTASTAAAPGS